jgi:hypothetical protein
MIKKKPRRRNSRKPKRGFHTSPKLKNSPAHYRSGLELKYMLQLDADVTVDSYEYESIIVGYISNYHTAKVRKYIVDFLVNYNDGRKLLVEVKPLRKTGQKIVTLKRLAAERWCVDNGATFMFVTEKML